MVAVVDRLVVLLYIHSALRHISGKRATHIYAGPIGPYDSYYFWVSPAPRAPPKGGHGGGCGGGGARHAQLPHWPGGACENGEVGESQTGGSI